jgi:Glycosyltransferase like family
MLAFGCAITRPEVYARCAQPGIARVREPDSAVLELQSGGTLFAAYNALLEQARGLEDLEALVLLHQDTEIVSEDFCEQVRATLADPDVGLAGCAGAVGVSSIAWWEASETLASFKQLFEEHGGGEVEAFSWTWEKAPPYARLGDVETLDGFLLILSPWAVRELSFDESLGQIHGYDLDFCLQVREAGKRVVTTDVRAIHHHALEPFSDTEQWKAAHVAVAEKWENRSPGLYQPPGSWRERALRAEAVAAGARMYQLAEQLDRQARLRELDRAISETTGSISWKLTAPLRLRRRRA